MGDQSVGSSSESKRWVRRLGKGETLFEEGDTDRRVYVLVDGKVEVLQKDRRVAVIGVGDTFIGEISALTGHPRSATVRTLQEWEQGRREPSGAALSLIRVANERPDVLRELFLDRVA